MSTLFNMEPIAMQGNPIHQHTLYVRHSYQRKFINIGIMAKEYQASASYQLRAKLVEVDVQNSTSLAAAMDATTSELAQLGLISQQQVAEVNPYAVELSESALAPSSHNEEFDKSLLALLSVQSDLLHKNKLMSLARSKEPWPLAVESFSGLIAQLVSEAAIHFSQQSRKILLLPEFLASYLLAQRLSTDRSRSYLDELKDIARQLNIAIDQYPCPPSATADVLLFQHDAITVFSGLEPHLRKEYESLNGLTRTRQYLFSVCGYVLNAVGAARDHVIVHLPVEMPHHG